MKLPRSKPELLVDATRPPLANLYFQKDPNDPFSGTVMAADGFSLAVVSVDSGPDETSGPIGATAIKEARKGGKNAHREIEIDRPNLRVETYRGSDGEETVFTAPEDCVFPDTEQILGDCRPNFERDYPLVALNAELLYRVAQAVCNPDLLHVSIYANKGRNQALYIKPHQSDADCAEGALMPVHIPREGLPDTKDPEAFKKELALRLKSIFRDAGDSEAEHWTNDQMVLTGDNLIDLATLLGIEPPIKCPGCRRYVRLDLAPPFGCQCGFEWETKQEIELDERRIRILRRCPKCGDYTAEPVHGSSHGYTYACYTCQLKWASLDELGVIKEQMAKWRGKPSDGQYGRSINDDDNAEEVTTGSEHQGAESVEERDQSSAGGDADGNGQDGNVPVVPEPGDEAGPTGVDHSPPPRVDPPADGADSPPLAEAVSDGNGDNDGVAEPVRRRRRRRNRANACNRAGW